MELAAAFRRAQGRELGESDGPLQTALITFWEKGHAAWPELSLAPNTLAGYLGERAPKDQVSPEWLNKTHAEDLFLACACLGGSPQALRAFDETVLSNLGIYLKRLSPTPEVIAETRQLLMEKLFVGIGGQPPRIAQYSGEGRLAHWVRIAAVRTALTLLTANRAAPHTDEVETIATAIAPGGNPEFDLLRSTYQREFTSALGDSIGALSQRDRALIRFAFVERMTPAQIGDMYGCHRTTAMRWIEAACEATLKHTQRGLMERLKISQSECDRLYALVKSQLDLSLSRLLASS
jgi:RNA polymerase sigma-70 factor (ECF subfamily)